MKRFIPLLLITSLATSQINYPPSITPPGNFDEDDIPMFVCVGWDDNAYVDATEWFGDYIRNKRNNDGSAARTTFLFATGLINEKFNSLGNPGVTVDSLRNSWIRLAEDGHEIGNHTHTHSHGSGKEKSWWDNEIDLCNASLVNDLGVDENTIIGFRTPYLEYSTGTFQSLQERGGRYDCSIEFGYNWVQLVKPTDGYTDPATGSWVSGEPAIVYSPGKAAGGFNHFWPYTLDNGYAEGSTPYGGATVGSIPGFWEIPVIAYQNVPTEWDENNPDSIDGDWNIPNGVTTGFDFNMFKTHSDVEYILKVLKFNFHQRLKGNRSPFNLNLHTDNYSPNNPDAEKEFGEKDYLKRRWVIEQFIDYVLQFEDVRVVPYNAVIDYMENPEIKTTYVAPTSGNSNGTVATQAVVATEGFAMKQINGSSLEMSVPIAGNYTVRVTSLSGREIGTIHSGSLSAGIQSFDLSSVSAGAGIYLVQIEGAATGVARVMLK